MGLILSTQEGSHGTHYLPSSEVVRNTNKHMLERYYATGEGRFDIDRKKRQDKEERKRRRQNLRSDDEDDGPTERIRVKLSYPDATRVPGFIRIVEETDASEDDRSGSKDSPGWREQPPRYPAARHPEHGRRHERHRAARKHDRSREMPCKNEWTIEELVRDACKTMQSYVPHDEDGKRVVG